MVLARLFYGTLASFQSLAPPLCDAMASQFRGGTEFHGGTEFRGETERVAAFHPVGPIRSTHTP